MRWRLVREEIFPQLVSFLAPIEWGCVTFTARLIRDGAPALPSRRAARICACVSTETGHPEVRAAVLQSNYGFYFPVLDGRDSNLDQCLAEDLRRTLRLSAAGVYSIMGRKRDARAFEKLLGKRPLHEIEYFLMVQEREGGYDSSRLPDRLSIRRADIEDTELLFPLQREYEIEEVLLPGDRFDSSASRHHLRMNLIEQMVFVAELDGSPVAKAGTNARGFVFDQIGGVFTRSDLRRRGIGAALMTRLMNAIATEGRSCCLFVKQHNAAAIAMYTRLGYLIRDEFRITYY